MARESAHNYKVDIPAIAATLLQVSPIILVVIYVLEYSYAFQFLAQFGVTPEEVGISEIKFLSRAALLTLVVVSLYGMLFVAAGLFFTVRASIAKSSRIQRILIKFKLIEQPEVKSDQADSLRGASKRAQVVRIGGTLAFALTMAVVILIAVGGPGLRLGVAGIVSLAAIGLILTAALFVGWRESNTRYWAWTSGTILGIVLLGLATYFGGTHNGIDAARSGHVSPFASALGVDILQVHPEWLDKNVIPAQYIQDQDMLELGSDATTAFLYDCWTATTYSIPLDDVVLTYPLSFNQPNSTILRRLRCH